MEAIRLAFITKCDWWQTIQTREDYDVDGHILHGNCFMKVVEISKRASNVLNI